MRIIFSITLMLLVACLSCLPVGRTEAYAKDQPASRPFNEKQTRLLYSSYLRGVMFSVYGDDKKALANLRRVKGLDRQSVQARLKIASLLLRTGNNKGAEVELKEAQALDPSNVDVSLSLIFLYSSVKNDNALEGEYGSFLENVHAQKPDNVKISEYLGQFYFYKNRIDDAVKVYEALVKAKPDYVEGMFWLGYLYAESNKRAEAIDIWLKVLKLEPSHAPTLNSLGYVYVEDCVKLDEAEVMIKRAVEKEPENGAYLDSLGWLYFKKKDYKAADDYLNRALVLLKDPIVYEHLGDVWAGAKDLKKALNYYEEGIKYFPSDKNLQEKVKLYGSKDKTIKK